MGFNKCDSWRYARIDRDENDREVTHCNLCDHNWRGNDRMRLVRHLSGSCKQANSEVVESVKQILDDQMTSRNKSSIVAWSRGVASDTRSSWSHSDSSMPTKRLTKLDKFIDTVTPTQQSKIKEALAQWIFSSGQPFSVTESAEFEDFIKAVRPGLKLPKRKEISNELLDKQYNTMQRKQKDFIQSYNNKFTLISDGWTNQRGEPIINYTLVSADGHSFFHSSDPSGEECHTASYLAEKLEEVIEDVGRDKIVAICTDSAANMKAALNILQKSYPEIYMVRCHSHQLNLIIGEILKEEPMRTVLSQAVAVNRWYRNHHFPNARLKAVQKQLYGKEIALSVPCPTRWQSNLDCVQSLLSSKTALEQTAIDPDVREAMKRSAKAGFDATKIRDWIIADEWWNEVENLRRIVETVCAGNIRA